MPKKTVNKKADTKTKVSSTKKTSGVPNAYVISQYYGFRLIELPNVDKEDIEKAKSIRKASTYSNEILPSLEESLAIIRHCKDQARDEITNKMIPLMFYQEGYLKGSGRKNKPLNQNIGLHIVGSSKSIAEALLIKTALSILDEEGIANVGVEINNIGGKEDYGLFLKELQAFYRKHINDMDSVCRESFKDCPHSLISCNNSEINKLSESAPASLEFLTENNRKHFSEVIEFLETEEIPYSINKNLLGDPHYSSSTVFSIIDLDANRVVATGTRCDQLARKMGHRKEIPAISLSLSLNKPKRVPVREIPKPNQYKFYFIQLGLDAKRMSLKVLDMLRKEGIPVHHSVVRDRLSTQLDMANRHRVPYILLMGQREAYDNSVTVRNTTNHSQQQVAISDLAKHLKKILKTLN